MAKKTQYWVNDLCFCIAIVIAAIGIIAGFNSISKTRHTNLVHKAELNATIRALNGNPIYQLEKQADGSVIWVRTSEE
jgi:hypothetical protein